MKRRKFADGGETELEEGSGGYGEVPEMKAEEPEKPKTFKEAFAEARAAGDKTFMWNGKKYTTDVAGSKSSAPVPGRPRGESMPVSVTRQMADRAAAETASARASSEARAAKAREAASELAREVRGRAMEPKAKRLSMTGVNPNTMLPYAKGGSVGSASKRADGIAQRGKTRGTMVMCGGGMARGKK